MYPRRVIKTLLYIFNTHHVNFASGIILIFTVNSYFEKLTTKMCYKTIKGDAMLNYNVSDIFEVTLLRRIYVYDQFVALYLIRHLIMNYDIKAICYRNKMRFCIIYLRHAKIINFIFRNTI